MTHSANSANPEFRARLQALNDKYAASIPTMMAVIAQASERCANEGAGQEQLGALNKSLHAVAGSAGTFGFASLGLECRRLEQQARSLIEGPSAAQQSGWPALQLEVEQLLHLAQVDAKNVPQR